MRGRDLHQVGMCAPALIGFMGSRVEGSRPASDHLKVPAIALTLYVGTFEIGSNAQSGPRSVIRLQPRVVSAFYEHTLERSRSMTRCSPITRTNELLCLQARPWSITITFRRQLWPYTTTRHCSPMPPMRPRQVDWIESTGPTAAHRPPPTTMCRCARSGNRTPNSKHSSSKRSFSSMRTYPSRSGGNWRATSTSPNDK